MAFSHEKIETNVVLLSILILVTISVGGLVQLVPLATMDQTIEKVQGMRPYSPLELMGRNIYVREGCYLCHSQMVRSFRDEVERYGHYSLAAESLYDHPFQWGSKRSGPDLARVGGKYSNDWHALHMVNPRAVVPESIMPAYSFLARRELRTDEVAEHLKTLRMVGVPYTEDDIANALADLRSQAGAGEDDPRPFTERYPKAPMGDFDGDPKRVTELDALIAYLQILGTMVDFTTFRPEMSRR
ncbi:MAG: cytochrome-c oxidase, cbb3-type subunit II [Rhodospirillales bacterium]|nr:cytochrome-c oxidase, cbb3-type subunit II [Rhodospirillales bacterium]